MERRNYTATSADFKPLVTSKLPAGRSIRAYLKQFVARLKLSEEALHLGHEKLVRQFQELVEITQAHPSLLLCITDLELQEKPLLLVHTFKKARSARDPFPEQQV